jgi:hypothetical protein
MQKPDNHKFKNFLTERFHDYFYEKLRDKVIDPGKFWEDFGLAEASRYSFFSAMRSGHRGVSAEQVLIAWDKYGVRPDYLFGIVDDPLSIAAEPAPIYAKSISTDISKIRKLLDEVEKKVQNM